MSRPLLSLLGAIILTSNLVAQNGVFSVGGIDDMSLLSVQDTCSAPWLSTDELIIDLDQDEVADIRFHAHWWSNGPGDHRWLNVALGDSTTLALDTAIRFSAVVGQIPAAQIPVSIPLRTWNGETTTGEEVYGTVQRINYVSHGHNPQWTYDSIFSWPNIEDGYMLFRKVEETGTYYGWIRVKTQDFSTIIVHELAYQGSIAQTGIHNVLAEPPALQYIGMGQLRIERVPSGTLCIVDASGRKVHEERLPASSSTTITLPHLGAGVFVATVQGAEGSSALRFVPMH